MKKIKVCSQCGSQEITGHSLAGYNWFSERWESYHQVDHVTCDCCNMEVTTKDILAEYTTSDLWFYFNLISAYPAAKELRKMLDKPNYAKKVDFKPELTSKKLADLLLTAFIWTKTNKDKSFWQELLDRLQRSGL
jgi:hypothetical protein